MFLLGADDSLSEHGPSPFDNRIRLMRRIAIGLVPALLVALPELDNDRDDFYWGLMSALGQKRSLS